MWKTRLSSESSSVRCCCCHGDEHSSSFLRTTTIPYHDSEMKKRSRTPTPPPSQPPSLTNTTLPPQLLKYSPARILGEEKSIHLSFRRNAVCKSFSDPTGLARASAAHNNTKPTTLECSCVKTTSAPYTRHSALATYKYPMLYHNFCYFRPYYYGKSFSNWFSLMVVSRFFYPGANRIEHQGGEWISFIIF